MPEPVPGATDVARTGSPTLVPMPRPPSAPDPVERDLIHVLLEAATAMPWAEEEIDLRLVQWATDAVGATVSLEPATADTDDPTALSVPLHDERVLLARRETGSPGSPRSPRDFSDLDRRLLVALAAMATTSARHAQREARLRRRALTDDLTGLWSHGIFPDLLATASRRREDGEQLGVLFLDLDRFKQINEELGHLDADAVLREVARRLLAALPPDSVVGRVGGDEFACVVRRLEGEDGLAETRTLLRQTVNQPIHVGDRLLSVDVSIGGVVSVSPDEDPDALLRAAEEAMRAAKRGREDVAPPRWYDEKTLVRDLLDQGGVGIALQPMVLLGSGRVVGYEALVRADHGDLGAVSPLLLVGSASRTQMLDELTEVVAAQAVETVAAIARDNQTPQWLCLNVEFEQLVPGSGLVPALAAAVAGTDVRLVLEISEREIGRWTGAHDAVARDLDQAGIGLAVDDFGGGHATFALLHSWPWRWVKIDQALVSARDDDTSRVLLGHVVTMLRDLGLTAVAEGVESTDQQDLLRSLGVPLAQGTLFAAPTTAALVRDAAATQRHAAPPDL